MTMMFEVEDLTVASPATVSRCGMIYMEPESLGIQPLIDSWIQIIPPNLLAYKGFKARLVELFSLFVADALFFLRRNLKELLTSMNNNLVQSLCRILDCFFILYKESELKKVSEDEIKLLVAGLDSLFVFALIWSIGATTDYEGREKFSEFVRNKITQKEVKAKFPDTDQIYNYEYILSGN